MSIDVDDFGCINVPFKMFSLISAQTTSFLILQSMIESMGVRTTEPDYSSRGESNPGRQITGPTPYRLS